MPKSKYQGFCKPPSWDVEEGKRLFDSGMRVVDIARKLGIEYHKVWFYCKSHWEVNSDGR